MRIELRNREDIIAYIKRENTVNNYGAPEEAFGAIADLIMYMGRELCRPISRLLLANWKELQARINSFDAHEWEMPKKVAAEIGLNPTAVALLIEVLEGQDTKVQAEAGKTSLTPAEQAMIKEHLKAARTEVPPEEGR